MTFSQNISERNKMSKNVLHSIEELSDTDLQMLMRTLYLEEFVKIQKRNEELEKENETLRKKLRMIEIHGEYCPCGNFIPNSACDNSNEQSGWCVWCGVPFCGSEVGCSGSEIYHVLDEDEPLCKPCILEQIDKQTETLVDLQKIYKDIDELKKHLEVCHEPFSCDCGAYLRK